jgi:hypothetical protein
MQKISRIIGLSILLTGCATLNPDHKSSGICNTLNSDIIFNGATANDRNAELQGAERALQQHMYSKHCT